MEIKDGLRQRAHLDTAIAWIRRHTGTLGNKRADGQAAFTCILGDIQETPEVATGGGVRQASKAIRASWRQNPGYGKRRTDLHRHAFLTYTGMGANRGPPKTWLSQIGKAADSEWACGYPVQDGDHIVFSCPSCTKRG